MAAAPWQDVRSVLLSSQPVPAPTVKNVTSFREWVKKHSKEALARTDDQPPYLFIWCVLRSDSGAGGLSAETRLLCFLRSPLVDGTAIKMCVARVCPSVAKAKQYLDFNQLLEAHWLRSKLLFPVRPFPLLLGYDKNCVFYEYIHGRDVKRTEFEASEACAQPFQKVRETIKEFYADAFSSLAVPTTHSQALTTHQRTLRFVQEVARLPLTTSECGPHSKIITGRAKQKGYMPMSCPALTAVEAELLDHHVKSLFSKASSCLRLQPVLADGAPSNFRVQWSQETEAPPQLVYVDIDGVHWSWIVMNDSQDTQAVAEAQHYVRLSSLITKLWFTFHVGRKKDHAKAFALLQNALLCDQISLEQKAVHVSL